jgi:N-acetylmuramic acid 6-phosphate etherase
MSEEKRITESDSIYRHLEQMPVSAMLSAINSEDAKVAAAVEKALPAIEKLVEAVVEKMRAGGRLFYMGAGTSGRLGIVDASECPPTFGIAHGIVIGIIAGGDGAIRKAVEFAEDDTAQGWKDLQQYEVTASDVVIGIAASGSTPYVVGALEACNKHGIITGAITCNPGSPVARVAAYPVEVIVGPEFVTGSTRMKAGTAQKMVLNMISTAAMVKLGRVKDNKMVDMQLSNNKLIDRGRRMIMKALSVGYDEAGRLLDAHGSVRNVLRSRE